jgi:hypothetical protein
VNAESKFEVGDKVVINPAYATVGFRGITFEIERFKQVNVLLRPISGSPDGRKIDCRPEYLLHVHDVPVDVDLSADVELPPVYAGQVVTVKDITSPRWRYAPDTRFVILGATTADRVKIAKLGGDGGRTWTLLRAKVTVTEV